MIKQMFAAGFVVCIAIMLTIMAAGSSAGAEEGFDFNAVPVPDGIYLQLPVVSIWSNNLSAVCAPTGLLFEGRTLVQYEISGSALLQQFSFPLSEDDAKPLMLVEPGLVLFMDREPSAEGSGDRRNGLVFKLMDTASGAERNVTPANLLQTTPWPKCGFPPVLWSEQHGLTMLIYEPETHQVVIWQGKDTLQEVQRTPPIVACGGAFLEGRYVRVEITNDGVALVFDWDTGMFMESGSYAALGSEIAQLSDLPPDEPLRLALTPDLAVFKSRKTGIIFTVISSDGSRQDIKRIEAEESDELDIEALMSDENEPTSRWNELTDAEKEAAARDLLLGYERDKGLELAPDVISGLSYITPIDDQRVGIVDTVYQRLIVIGLPDAE